MAARSQRTADNPAPDLARRLSIAYSALVRGLMYPGSEGDSYYQPFHVAYTAETFDLDNFRDVTGLMQSWDLRAESGIEFLQGLAKSQREGTGDESVAEAAAYEALEDVMRATSTGDLHRVVVTAGDSMRNAWHPTRHYVFGEVPGGLAGLVVLSVET
jgi:hypothetical protein